ARASRFREVGAQGSSLPQCLEYRIRLARLDHERVVDDVLDAVVDGQFDDCGAAAASTTPVLEWIIGDRQERADATGPGVVDRRAGVDRRQGDLVLVRADQRCGVDGQDVVRASAIGAALQE